MEGFRYGDPINWGGTPNVGRGTLKVGGDPKCGKGDPKSVGGTPNEGRGTLKVGGTTPNVGRGA